MARHLYAPIYNKSIRFHVHYQSILNLYRRMYSVSTDHACFYNGEVSTDHACFYNGEVSTDCLYCLLYCRFLASLLLRRQSKQYLALEYLTKLPVQPEQLTVCEPE